MSENTLKRINYHKIVYCFLIVVSICSLGKVCIDNIRKISAVETKAYYVEERSEIEVEADSVYEKEFLCVGKKTRKLQILSTVNANTAGKLKYQIIDSSGVILSQETCGIDELIEGDEQGLFIEVTDVRLEQGKRYLLRVDFSETNNLSVRLGNNQLQFKQIFDFAYKQLYITAIVVCMILVTLWLIWIYKRELTAKCFWVTLIFAGIVVVFVMPPANRDDEYRHFVKVYTVAENIEIKKGQIDGTESGIVGSEGVIAEVPYEINELRLMDYEGNKNGYGYLQELNLGFCLEKMAATLKADGVDEKFKVGVEATSDRGLQFYWPQIIAVKLASVFNVRDLGLYYFARIGQLLTCVFMGILSIKLAPKLKEIIWLIAFTPSVLLLVASCNCDGLLIWEIILLFSVIVWMQEQKIPILSRRGMIGVIVYLILMYNIISMKIPYMIVCAGALLLLKKENVPHLSRVWTKATNLQKIISIVLICVVGSTVLILGRNVWLNILSSFLPSDYIHYMLTHKRTICKLFAAKWKEMLVQLFTAMKGRNIIPYPSMMIVICILLKKNQTVVKRICFAVLFLIMVMVIVLVGYTLTPPDYGVIWGITFRYILPFVILGLVALPLGTDKTDKIAKKMAPLSIYLAMGSSLIAWFTEWSV